MLKLKRVASCRLSDMSRLSDDQLDMESVLGESVSHSAIICWPRQSSTEDMETSWQM